MRLPFLAIIDTISRASVLYLFRSSGATSDDECTGRS